MAVKIRLARGGAKKRPFYRVVVADVRAPRDGKFIEKLGTYNPLLPKDNENRIVLNGERIKHWLDQGALPTERVEQFLVDADLYTRDKKRQQILDNRIAKSQEAAKKKAQEEAKKKAEKEAAEKAEAEAAAAEESAAEEAPAEEAVAETPVEEAEAPAEETASE